LLGLVCGSGLTGCSRFRAKPNAQAKPTGKDQASKAGSDQAFDNAVIKDPPADAQLPPDVTVAGKSVGKLYEETKKNWDAIRFTTDDGKPKRFTALLDTDLGVIEITLRPDWAPLHVRNFVALAGAGYYDGLFFERVVHEELKKDLLTVEDDTEARQAKGEAPIPLDYIEGGCPLGTGAPGYGSIGYWLRPEFNPQLHHEEGTVGACHGPDADTAACRFYITLGKAPPLDGNYTVFGKVTRGLDVVRKIHARPVRRDDQDPDQDSRPVKPVVIKSVTITTQVEDPH